MDQRGKDPSLPSLTTRQSHCNWRWVSTAFFCAAVVRKWPGVMRRATLAARCRFAHRCWRGHFAANICSLPSFGAGLGEVRPSLFGSRQRRLLARCRTSAPSRAIRAAPCRHAACVPGRASHADHIGGDPKQRAGGLLHVYLCQRRRFAFLRNRPGRQLSSRRRLCRHSTRRETSSVPPTGLVTGGSVFGRANPK
jgi:hypothetical protein